jgi:hypothetical protein
MVADLRVTINGSTQTATLSNYDLLGRIVNHPKSGNIYIINGKKVVMK